MGGISIRWIRENDENNNSLVRLNYWPINDGRNYVNFLPADGPGNDSSKWPEQP
jgi:hypothetical protein